MTEFLTPDKPERDYKDVLEMYIETVQRKMQILEMTFNSIDLLIEFKSSDNTLTADQIAELNSLKVDMQNLITDGDKLIESSKSITTTDLEQVNGFDADKTNYANKCYRLNQRYKNFTKN